MALVIGLSFAGIGNGHAQLSYNDHKPQIATPKTGDTVRSRPNEQFDALGIRAGSSRIYPTLGVYGLYDDNVFAVDSPDEESDIALLLSPAVEVVSDWNRHELLFFVGGDFAFYDDFSSEDYKNLTLQTQATIDITRASHVVIFGSFRDMVEPRGDPDAVFTGLEPVKYEQIDVGLQFYRHVGKIRLSAGGAFVGLNYKNRERLDLDELINSDRDRQIFRVNARVDYEFQTNLGLFVDFSYNWRDYDLTEDRTGVTRDSEGYEITAGIDVRLTELIFGYAYIGYSRQKYEQPFFEDVKGLAFGIDIETHFSQRNGTIIGNSDFINNSFLQISI